MKKKICFFLSLLLCSLSFFAQQHELTGFIVESGSGNPVSYATVFSKEQAHGAVTDTNGYFQISLEAGTHTLIFKSIGFETKHQKINLTHNEQLDVELKPHVRRLETVVVTGTRTPKLLKDVPVPTRVISAMDIEKNNSQNVKDVLESELPGVEFTSHGGQTKINMQGLGGKYILFLVDGERLAGETFGNIDYDRLNADNIARVEVLKGAASSLYGSNAIGGVVNIITKAATKPLSVNVGSQFTSHGGQKYNLQLGVKSKKVTFSSSNFYKMSPGYVLSDTEHTRLKQEDSEIVIVDPILRKTLIDTSIVYGFDQKLQYRPTEKLSFTLKGGYFHRGEHVVRDLKAQNHIAQYNNRKFEKNQDNQSLNGGFLMDYDITKSNRLSFSFLRDRYEKDVVFYLADNQREKVYLSLLSSARLQYNYDFKDAYSVTIGGEYLKEELEGDRFKGRKFVETFVLYTQHEYNINKKWRSLYGARLDYNPSYGLNLTNKTAMMCKVDAWSFISSYSQGIRTPTLKELYQNWKIDGHHFILLGNKELRPERSQNLSLSGEYSFDRWNFSVVGFWNQISEKISLGWSSAEDTARYINIDQSTSFGADVNASVKLPYGFGARVSYSIVKDEQDADEMALTPSRPHSATFRFDYEYRYKKYMLNIALSARALSGVTIFEKRLNHAFLMTSYSMDLPSYSFWKLVVNQRFREGLSLSMGIENLFNYRPPVFASNTLMDPGRYYFVSLSCDFISLFERQKNAKK